MPLKFVKPSFLLMACLLVGTAACATADSRSSTVRVRVQEPEAGQELCYFQETPSYIGVDFEEGRIEVCPEKKMIFYPPSRCGKNRPHQVRWTVRCLNGEKECMRKGDLVVIRPKETFPEEGGGHDDRKPERCVAAEVVANKSLCTGQELPADIESLPEVTTYERRLSFKQRHTMFAQESKGVFVIPHTTNSVSSGIPNPDFGRGVSLGWYYNIELQRDGKTIACVDPDLWIEKDHG